MIDTIRLRIKQPIIRPDSPMVLVPPATQGGRTHHDRVLEIQRPGKKILDVIREGYLHQEFVGISSFANYLMIVVQLPQYFQRDATSVQPLTRDETVQAFGRLQTWLGEVAGIEVNIWETEISRLDLFANAKSLFTMEDYQPLLETLKFKRKVPQRYPTTFTLISSGQAICLYDKGVQQKQPESQGMSLIRCEFRLKRARSVQRVLKIRTLAELLDNWDRIAGYYVSQVQKILRITKPLERDPDVVDLSSEIGQLAKEPGDMAALTDWIMTLGVRYLAERNPQLGDIKPVLRGMGYKPYQISRFLDKLAELRSIKLMGDMVSLNDLRAELYRGLVG